MSSIKRPHIIISLVVAFFVLATSCTGDTSGVGAFERVAVDTDLYAISGTTINNSSLLVDEIRTLRSSVDTDIDVGSEIQVDDIFNYSPALREPIKAIIAFNQDEGSYRYVYIHDPVTDEPIESFPTEKTSTGMSPVELLDCLATETEVAPDESRFNTLIEVIDTDDVDAIWRCGT